MFPTENYQVISVGKSLDILNNLDIVGVDTETEGLDPYTKKLLLLQLGNYNNQVVIDCTTIDIQLYKNYLESDRLFIFWNALFDLRFLFHQRIVVTHVYDGYLAEKLLYLGYPAGMHSMSLKSAGINYLNVEMDKSVRGKIIQTGTLHMTDDIVIYSANDVKYLEKIMDCQHKLLEEKDLIKASKIENLFVVPLAYTQYCGVKLDVDKWKEKVREDTKKLKEKEDELNKWVEEHFPEKYCTVNLQGDLWNGFDTKPHCNINWNSAKQVIPLFKDIGCNLQVKDKKTSSMKDSVDAKVIKAYKDVSSLIPIYLDYKASQKVVSTYGNNFLKQINPVSHRIHTQYNQLGADTTRITSGGKDGNVEYVNLLNLPADALTRSCFIAEKGNKWISIDYSGQETYLMASIANDKAIIDELTYGSKDIHSLVAYISYPDKIPRDTPIKEIKQKFHALRQEAKGVEFGINYGGNADTIHRNKGIPLEEAKEIYNQYMSGFKGLQKYQSFRRKDWWDKGYILLNEKTRHKAFIYDYKELKDLQESFQEEGFWDRYREDKKHHIDSTRIHDVRHFFKRKSSSERQSINYPIQATGSMCLRVSMIKFFKYLHENNLLFKVLITITPYDEINCEAPEGIANSIAKEVHKCMVEAGKIFCTRCKLDADISYDKDGKLPNYWIH